MATSDNLAHIERLNQRGGRMLSVMDLLAAGTFNSEIASLLLFLMSKNPSFLACAGPGGAGKTTLLGALLVHLPENVKILDYGDNPSPRGNVCFLAHEVSGGDYYGYIRDEDARRFFSLASKSNNISVSATAHADTADELAEFLTASHGVRDEDIFGLDFLAFINFTPYGRRLISLWQGTGGGFRTVYSYNPKKDGWDRNSDFDCAGLGISAGEFREGLAQARRALKRLEEENARDISHVRRLL